MSTKRKIWLGVGAFILAGGAASSSVAIERGAATAHPSLNPADQAAIHGDAPAMILAQHSGHGGEAGEGGSEGGEKGGGAKLPPDLDFSLKIAQLRGHLVIGDELVKQGQWSAALPHFLHPTEEIYGEIRSELKTYNVPPFEAALKLLATLVKTKKGGDDYAKAMQNVQTALAAADAGLKQKQSDWNAFTVETAVELLKSAAGEYEEAIVKNRIGKAVEYQDARGFIWHADALIEGIAPALQSKDAEGLKHVREGIAALKAAFPTAMPPKVPVKDYPTVLGDISRVEFAAGKLM